MNNLELAKWGLRAVASSGVYKVVSELVKSNTDVIGPVSKAQVWVGRIVLGSIVADRARTHVDEKIDQAVTWYEKQKNEAGEGEEPKPAA